MIKKVWKILPFWAASRNIVPVCDFSDFSDLSDPTLPSRSLLAIFLWLPGSELDLVRRLDVIVFLGVLSFDLATLNVGTGMTQAMVSSMFDAVSLVEGRECVHIRVDCLENVGKSTLVVALENEAENVKGVSGLLIGE